MAWIESHQEMARHPKTRRVALRLGISKAAVIGHLHLLWWWTLDFAPDGDLSGFDAEEIATVAEWEGDAEQFLQALLDTGWLDEGRRVHNWGDYAGRLVTAREGIRERQRRCREKKRDAAPPSSGDVTPMSRPCHGDVTPMSQLRHADVTVTSPLRHGTQNSTEQNRTQPNRERVARGRASGPAERSAGVPSLSRSHDLVSDGEHSAPAGGEDGAGNAFSPDSGDRRERREPGPGDGRGASVGVESLVPGLDASRFGERVAPRGEDGSGGSRALSPDREVSLTDGGLVRAHSVPAELEASRVGERDAPRGEVLRACGNHALLHDDGGPDGAGSLPEGTGVDLVPEGSLDAGRLSYEEGEPSGGGGGASRPKVAALRVAAGDFSPANGAPAGGGLPGGESVAGGPPDHGLPRLANGGNAPPMGDDARDALRQDAAFREAWRGWRLHLADLGRPLMSRGQERALLRECARRGPARAVEVIAYSITKGAKNLIWDDAPRARRPQQPAAGAARKPNPEGWLEWLAGEYPDRAGIAYADAPESVQGEFRRTLQKTG